jgi:hypothetical protein
MRRCICHSALLSICTSSQMSFLVLQLGDQALELYFLGILKDWKAPQNLTRVLYEKTTDMSSLRKLHLYIIMDTQMLRNLRDNMDDHPKEFLIDLLEASRDRPVYVSSHSACDGLNEWIAGKKARFCEHYHEYPRLDSYPVYEPT